MLMMARAESESKVANEIRRLEQQAVTLQEKSERVNSGLAALDPAARFVNKEHFRTILAQMEKRWEEELTDVKRELHQTILAHNHNADLMADHKATLDRYKVEIADRDGQLKEDVRTRLSEVEEHSRGQLRRVEAVLEREQLEDQQLGALTQRIEALTQQLYGGWAAQTAPPLWPVPPVPPYGPGPGAIPPHGYRPGGM